MTELRECAMCGDNARQPELMRNVICNGCGLTARDAAAWNRRADDWMPIETAPRDVVGFVWVRDASDRLPDGTREGRIAEGSVQTRGDSVVGRARGFTGDWDVTHWRPLPEGPR